MIITPLNNVVGNSKTRKYHSDKECSHKPTSNTIFKLYTDETGRVFDAQGNIYTLCSYCEKVEKIKSHVNEVVLHV